MKGMLASSWRLRAVLLGLVGWLWVSPVAQAQEPQGRVEGRLIDQVVAIIEGQVLTRSELEFETRVVLVQKGGLQAASAPLDDEALKGGLELAISLRLQVLSADRQEVLPEEQANIEARLERFRELFESAESFQAFLARAGAGVGLLTEVMARQVRAERVLDSRIRPKVQVSEAEVLRYYQQHASKYPEGYTAVKPQLQSLLKKERYDELAAKDLAELRRAAQIRRVAPFAREVRR